MATLALCLFFPKTSTQNPSPDPILISSLLKVEPGHLAYYDEQFHATFNGQLILEIKQERLTFNPADIDVIRIDGLNLDYNTQLSLHWKIEDHTFVQTLNDGSPSLTAIDFQTTEVEQITDLHLLISTDFELNNQPSQSKTVSFSSIYFDSQKNLSTWSMPLAKWFAFKPIEVNSINGMTSLNKLQYQGLIYRLMLWLSLNVLIYFIFRVYGIHLIIAITLAWLLTATPFLTNLIKQHQQIELAYPDEHEFINATDKRLFQLAKTIKTKISELTELKDHPHKYIILGSNVFETLRLFYHLTELNVGINTNVIKEDIEGFHLIYILTHESLMLCNDMNAEMWASDQFSLLLKDSEFCLVGAL